MWTLPLLQSGEAQHMCSLLVSRSRWLANVVIAKVPLTRGFRRMARWDLRNHVPRAQPIPSLALGQPGPQALNVRIP